MPVSVKVQSVRHSTAGDKLFEKKDRKNCKTGMKNPGFCGFCNTYAIHEKR